MPPFDAEKERILAELERLLTCVRTLPDLATESPTLSYLLEASEPFRRVMQHWKSIEAVVKDADELLSLAGFANAFASKRWLQLVLTGDLHLLLPWPIADVIRDLKFIQTRLLQIPLPDLKDALISKPSSAAEPPVAELVEAAPAPDPPEDRLPVAEAAKDAAQLPKQTFPNRARWFQERLDERDCGPDKFKQHGGPDGNTMRRILNGESVSDRTLRKALKGLNSFANFPSLQFSDIPTD